MQNRMKTHQLTPEECRELLETAETGCLATIGEDSTPYAVPVHYVYKDGKVWIHGLPAGEKVSNILRNPAVCFTVWQMDGYLMDPEGRPCETNTAYRSAVIKGTACLVQDPDAKREALHTVVVKYTPELKDRELPERMVQGTGVIEITVEEMTGKYYGDRPQGMKLTREGIRNTAAYAAAGIRLPSYSIEQMVNATKEAPVWVHFGIGNIFRVFIAGIADDLLEAGKMTAGISGVETFDYEIPERIYAPYDNLALSVILHTDGTSDKRVIGSIAEEITVRPNDEKAVLELRRIFTAPSLQMVSFTITEKGYALRNAAGELFDSVRQDAEEGPAGVRHTLSLVTAMLYARWLAGKYPLALVSMDNVSRNGEKLRNAVLEIAGSWVEKEWVPQDFLDYVSDEATVSFPWTMIDKITPRPSEDVQKQLEGLGLKGMDIVVTEKESYIAPFVNAEGPQYLVVEDRFPNGRPPLEDTGVYMTDRDTVNACERMKVTVCLNPLHTALAPFGCLLGYTRFSDVMKDAEMQKLVHLVGEEGMAVVKDPGILNPQAFLDECINVRFPNEYIPDTPQRIVVDTSQMVGIRFGETIKEYIARDGDASALKGIPLAIAGWIRYMLAEDDEGGFMPLSPDPMNEEIQFMLGDIITGHPETFDVQLKPLLSNANIFGSDLYEAGIGTLIEDLFRDMLRGPGSVRDTLIEYLG